MVVEPARLVGSTLYSIAAHVDRVFPLSVAHTNAMTIIFTCFFVFGAGCSSVVACRGASIASARLVEVVFQFPREVYGCPVLELC